MNWRNDADVVSSSVGRDLDGGREVFRKALQDALSSDAYFQSFQEEEPEYDALGDDVSDGQGAVTSD